MQIPGAFFSPTPKKLKQAHPEKKNYIFQEMELSGSNTKRILIFQETKTNPTPSQSPPLRPPELFLNFQKQKP